MIWVKTIFDIRDKHPCMNLRAAYFAVTFALVFVVASGALAEPRIGLVGQSDAASGVLDATSRSVYAASGVVVVAQVSHHDDCSQECCGQFAGSGCCPAGFSLACGCDVLDRALITACGIAGPALPAAGIHPDALLQPPQSFA